MYLMDGELSFFSCSSSEYYAHFSHRVHGPRGTTCPLCAGPPCRLPLRSAHALGPVTSGRLLASILDRWSLSRPFSVFAGNHR